MKSWNASWNQSNYTATEKCCHRRSLPPLPVFCLIGFLCTFLLLPAKAQDSLRIMSPDSTAIRTPAQDSLQKAQQDSVVSFLSAAALDSLRKIHNPRRAILYSAVLPGLGQAYNHQYIKIPLMYAGIGTAAGIFIFNFKHYTTFRDAYRLRLNGKYTQDEQINLYSLQDLKYLRDGYRQYVDYSVLGFAAAYLYNIIDAIVFAHLYKFDVSNDLGKVRFGPVLHQEDNYVGMGFTYTFKK